MKKIFAVTMLLVAMVSALTYCPQSVAASEQSGPADVIQKFNAALLESMKKAHELGYNGRFKLLQPVIEESFAIPFMAASTVGSSWRTLSETQKQNFLDIYAEWTIASYAGQFNDYSGERFELASVSKPVRDTVTVVSKLIKSDNEHVDFHYQIRNIDGRPKIVDIQIMGVSQLALTRAQFVSVLKTKGIDGLISMLKKKTETLAKKV